MFEMKIYIAALFVGLLAVQADAAIDIYFLRHGETTWNRAKILQGSISFPDLTAKGVRMAEETAKGLGDAGIRFDRIYTSPYRRARHTAEIIASRNAGTRPIDDSRLREMCFGRYEGIRYVKGSYVDDNQRLFFVDPDRYVPQGDGAEAFRHVQARLRDFLENEVRPLDGKVTNILCVAHSLVLRSLVREIAGDAASASATETLQRNCCVHHVRYEGGKFSLIETGRIFYDAVAFGSAAEPKMVAHRGAGDLTMPEASLPAYSNAVAKACDIVKLDVQFTKDGVAVMGHDVTLKRNMGWDANIADLTYGEIYENGRFLENGKPGAQRIVRLDQALAIVKTLPEFWIDFKDGKRFRPEHADKAMAAFAKAGINLSRVMVATFNRKALKCMRERYPRVRRVGHFSFAVQEDAKERKKTIEMAAAFGREYGLFGLNMPVGKRQTWPQDVAALKKHGLWVSLWFVQDAATAAEYRNSGADAFVTDNVSEVRAACAGGEM